MYNFQIAKKQLRVGATNSTSARLLKTSISHLRTQINLVQYFCSFLTYI